MKKIVHVIHLKMLHFEIEQFEIVVFLDKAVTKHVLTDIIGENVRTNAAVTKH